MSDHINEKTEKNKKLMEESLNDSQRLVESWSEVIESNQYSKIDENLKPHVARLLENISTVLNEDINSTSDVADWTGMITPIFREAVTKMKLLEVVGLQPMDQNPSSLFFERFYYGGNTANGTGTLLGSTARGTSDPDFRSWIINVEVSAGQHTTLRTSGAGTKIKASGGGGDDLATIVWVDELKSGKCKILVKLEDGKDLPAIGNIYAVILTANINMTDVWENQLYGSVLLPTYGGPMAQATGELNSDWNTVKISIESITVTAESHDLAFEISRDLVQDMMRRHKQDAKTRLTAAINWQLAGQNNMKLKNLMTSSAAVVSGWTYNGVDGRHEAEKLATLRRKVRLERNQVGVRNKRGVANFALCDSITASVVENWNGFIPTPQVTGENQAGIVKIGSVDGMTWYMDTFSEGQYIMLGYKGSDSDAGVFYMPYMPLEVETGTKYENMKLKKYSFFERSGYIEHPAGGDRYLSFITIDLSGSTYV